MDQKEVINQVISKFKHAGLLHQKYIKKPKPPLSPLRYRKCSYQTLREFYPPPWWFETLKQLRFTAEGRHHYRTFAKLTTHPYRKSKNA